MTTPASPYVKVLTLPSAARNGITSHGNEVVDILWQSRPRHTNLYKVSWWNQPGLKCYSPTPQFRKYHNVLAGGNASEAIAGGYFPDPDLSDYPYPVVTWKRTGGTNAARCVLADGDPACAEIKVMLGNAKVGSAWSFQTANLGANWDSGFGATKPGMLPVNGSIAFVIHRGINDTPTDGSAPDPAPYDYQGDGNAVILAAAAQRAADDQKTAAGNAGDIRCRVGNIWSVLIPGDARPAMFQKKTGLKAGAAVWTTMHTFPAIPYPEKPGSGSHEIIVSFVAISGRIAVCVGSKDLPSNSYLYSETDPTTQRQKTLTIQPGPAVISGVEGGNPVGFSIRRIGWSAFAQFTSTLGLTDANTPGITGSPALAPSGSFYITGYQPPLSPGLFTQVNKATATSITYTVTLTSTNDDREPCCAKWCKFATPRANSTGVANFTDFGPALLSFEENCNLPDFSGVGGNRGSNGKISLTFDIYGLNLIDAANGTNWRNDLAAYSECTFVLGNLFSDKTTAESTRMKGYLLNPKYHTVGFHDSTFTVELVDASVRLKRPAGFIDQRYAALSMIDTDNPSGVYGYQGVKYILGKAIDQQASESLRVFMPTNWPPLCDAYLQSLGKVPDSDVPEFMPPYGKDAAQFINDVAQVDYACLYPIGDTWVYGQFDLIVSGLPTVTVYDGTDGSGHILGSMTDQQVTFTITEAEQALDSAHDINKFVVWAKPYDGAGDNSLGEKFGVYLSSQSVQDSDSIAQSWERVDLSSTGQFNDPTYIANYLQKISQLTFGKNLGIRCKATIPYAPCFPAGSPTPALYWGYKVYFQGASDVNLSGRTMRIVKLTVSGNMVSKKVTTSCDLVEVIGG